jgi:hypothetical protein
MKRKYYVSPKENLAYVTDFAVLEGNFMTGKVVFVYDNFDSALRKCFELNEREKLNEINVKQNNGVPSLWPEI